MRKRNTKHCYAIGLDIGGTNTHIGIVDHNGHILAQESFLTYPRPMGWQTYTTELSDKIKAFIKGTPYQDGIAGIGIGAPNANYFKGTIELAANLPWKEEVPLAKIIADETKIPVIITNDANAATLGEMMFGAAKGMKDFYLITLGTGIGSGIVANGELLYGSDGKAGELGHVIIAKNGRECGCGRRGCLECYGSAKGLTLTAKELLIANNSEKSLLREYELDELTAKIIFEAAQNNDRIAKQTFELTGTILGENLANFAAFSSPEAIILFGGLTQAGDLLMAPLREAFDKNILYNIQKPKLLLSALPNADAALLGAASLIWKKLSDEQKVRWNNSRTLANRK